MKKNKAGYITASSITTQQGMKTATHAKEDAVESTPAKSTPSRKLSDRRKGLMTRRKLWPRSQGALNNPVPNTMTYIFHPLSHVCVCVCVCDV